MALEYRVETDSYHYVELYDGERYVAQIDSFLSFKQAQRICAALNDALRRGFQAAIDVSAGTLPEDPLEASYKKFDETDSKRAFSTMEVYDGNGFPLDTE